MGWLTGQSPLQKNPPAVPFPLSTSARPSSINYANLCTNTYHWEQVCGRRQGEGPGAGKRQSGRQTGAGMGWICQEQQLHKEYDLVNGCNRTDTQGDGAEETQLQCITHMMWCDSWLNTSRFMFPLLLQEEFQHSSQGNAVFESFLINVKGPILYKRRFACLYWLWLGSGFCSNTVKASQSQSTEESTELSRLLQLCDVITKQSTFSPALSPTLDPPSNIAGFDFTECFPKNLALYVFAHKKSGKSEEKSFSFLIGSLVCC